MLNNDSFAELSPQDIDMWDGAAHYISLQDVQIRNSDTTPLRIVSHSSLSDRKGPSLNSIFNTLSDQ